MAGELIQSVYRTFSVLECLAAKGEMGVRELHAAVGLSAPTVYRILNTLAHLGYVRQDASTMKYELTYKVLALGHSVTEHKDIVQLVHPILRDLSSEVKETVHFTERSGVNIRYIDKVVPSSGVVVMSSYLGLELPLYTAAAGKAILANLSFEESVDIWNRSEHISYTSKTISSLPELQLQLKEISRTGIAYDCGEREPGLFCMAVSISDVTGVPRYAVSISGPEARVDENQQIYADALQRTKARLTGLIGYSLHPNAGQTGKNHLE